MNQRIRASKLIDTKGYYVACDLDDPKAEHFDVQYKNNYQLMLHFTNKLEAENVARALDSEFQAGKKQQLADLRNYLGIN